MKKSVMYSETRTWFFDLDMAEGADLDEVMSVLKGTDGFYRYVDDGTSEEIECEWSEVPEDWRGKGDPDYTEEFREVAERELDMIVHVTCTIFSGRSRAVGSTRVFTLNTWFHLPFQENVNCV